MKTTLDSHDQQRDFSLDAEPSARIAKAVSVENQELANELNERSVSPPKRKRLLDAFYYYVLTGL